MKVIPEAIRERLVDDWRAAAKWWSVRWAAIGAIVLPSLQLIPATMPPEVQAVLPPSVRAAVTGTWCVGFIVLRLYAQRHPNG